MLFVRFLLAHPRKVMSRAPYFDLPVDMDRTPIPDATPQIVLEYQSNDEQAMLARVRYNRLRYDLIRTV